MLQMGSRGDFADPEYRRDILDVSSGAIASNTRSSALVNPYNLPNASPG